MTSKHSETTSEGVTLRARDDFNPLNCREFQNLTVEDGSYIDMWGVWPEDDKGKRHVLVENVASISESPLRLPAKFANELYRAGESGMGYCLFTLVFSDGSRQAYVSGNAIDFVHLPNGKTMADIREALPHEGRADAQKQSPEYFWCLFGEGEGAIRSQRFA